MSPHTTSKSIFYLLLLTTQKSALLSLGGFSVFSLFDCYYIAAGVVRGDNCRAECFRHSHAFADNLPRDQISVGGVPLAYFKRVDIFFERQAVIVYYRRVGLADIANVPRLEFYTRRALAVGRIADYKSVFPRLGVDELTGRAFDKALARENLDINIDAESRPVLARVGRGGGRGIAVVDRAPSARPRRGRCS